MLYNRPVCESMSPPWQLTRVVADALARHDRERYRSAAGQSIKTGAFLDIGEWFGSQFLRPSYVGPVPSRCRVIPALAFSVERCRTHARVYCSSHHHQRASVVDGADSVMPPMAAMYRPAGFGERPPSAAYPPHRQTPGCAQHENLDNRVCDCIPPGMSRSIKGADKSILTPFIGVSEVRSP
jgi:hypothetical protein